MTRSRRVRIRSRKPGEDWGPVRVVLLKDDESPARGFIEDQLGTEEHLGDVVSIEVPEVGFADPLRAKLTIFADVELDLDLDDVEITKRCRACGRDRVE